MSYLQLDKGLPNFKKLVLSLWFRVPQASVNATVRTGNNGELLDGIIPLVVMGKRGSRDAPYHATKTEFASFEATGWIAVDLSQDMTIETIGPCPAHGINSYEVKVTRTYSPDGHYIPSEPYHGTEFAFVLATDGDAPLSDHTFIGVDCRSYGTFLYINFETGQQPAVSGYWFNESISPGPVQSTETAFAFTQGTITITGCSLPFALILPYYDVVVVDDTHVESAPPGTSTGDFVSSWTDISEVLINATGAIYSDVIEVTPDHWHHLLVSVDLQTIQTHGGEWTGNIGDFVDSGAKLYVALDDVNYTGVDLTNNWTGRDPNETITNGAWEVAGEQWKDHDGNPIGMGLYILSEPEVPSGEEPIGLPGTKEVVDKILPVELAELQIFTGVTLDPAELENRRAFISEGGTPVSPVGKPLLDEDGLPVLDDEGNPVMEPSPAEGLLGKKPEILLHGSSNWIAGRNTGAEPSGSIDPDTGEPIDKPGEAFTPTGWIVQYHPDPSLNGPQMPEAEPAEPASLQAAAD